MHNVEIKAKVLNYDKICKLAESVSGGPATVLKQDDEFFHVREGRLKMRFEDIGQGTTATLVRYDRRDESGPKLADYDLLRFSVDEIDKAKTLQGMLQKCLGTRGRVVKERKLYMVGQTRIHVDAVQNLGHFMELEVVLRPEQSVDEGKKIAMDLQQKLEVKDEDLIECAYMDLIEKSYN